MRFRTAKVRPTQKEITHHTYQSNQIKSCHGSTRINQIKFRGSNADTGQTLPLPLPSLLVAFLYAEYTYSGDDDTRTRLKSVISWSAEVGGANVVAVEFRGVLSKPSQVSAKGGRETGCSRMRLDRHNSNVSRTRIS